MGLFPSKPEPPVPVPAPFTPLVSEPSHAATALFLACPFIHSVQQWHGVRGPHSLARGEPPHPTPSITNDTSHSAEGLTKPAIGIFNSREATEILEIAWSISRGYMAT
ncbi:hypothetical protein BOTBODRAFT_373485 [Botryobasidium botryosum FD-172 SS1]|uniref:Uncharacterized protein n=1 Tax=Botryobasidium botryosum (strain FD-172 SS1) TaxID=930990 RepID=A0A067MCV4_BOTB1|nr:hypothetical protein BOTBODRAFT_373485 [Botryobasidium botryosum FD-172 SS1]